MSTNNGIVGEGNKVDRLIHSILLETQRIKGETHDSFAKRKASAKAAGQEAAKSSTPKVAGAEAQKGAQAAHNEVANSVGGPLKRAARKSNKDKLAAGEAPGQKPKVSSDVLRSPNANPEARKRQNALRASLIQKEKSSSVGESTKSEYIASLCESIMRRVNEENPVRGSTGAEQVQMTQDQQRRGHRIARDIATKRKSGDERGARREKFDAEHVRYRNKERNDLRSKVWGRKKPPAPPTEKSAGYDKLPVKKRMEITKNMLRAKHGKK